MATKLTSKQEKLIAWAMGQAGTDLLTTPISNAWLHKGQKAGLVQGLIEQKDGMEAAAIRATYAVTLVIVPILICRPVEQAVYGYSGMT